MLPTAALFLIKKIKATKTNAACHPKTQKKCVLPTAALSLMKKTKQPKSTPLAIRRCRNIGVLPTAALFLIKKTKAARIKAVRHQLLQKDWCTANSRAVPI